MSYWTRWSKFNIARGMCGHCGRRRRESKTLCTKCLEYKRLRRKLRDLSSNDKKLDALIVRLHSIARRPPLNQGGYKQMRETIVAYLESDPCILRGFYRLMRTEDQVFDEYRQAGEETRPGLERELIKLLSKHATAIVWLVLHERSPETVNYAISLALRHAPSFRAEAKFSTWFQAIVKNICINLRRSRVNCREDYVGDAFDLDNLQARPAAIEASIAIDQLGKRLSESEQQLLSLKKVGADFETIADIMELSVKVVRDRWWRLRKKVGRWKSI